MPARVDMRLSAEENWYRRRMWIWHLCGASFAFGAMLSPVSRHQPLSLLVKTSDTPFESFQSNAANAVFSIGSPTIVPSSSRTNA